MSEPDDAPQTEVSIDRVFVYERPDTGHLYYTKVYELAYQEVTGYTTDEAHDWDDDHEETPDIRIWVWNADDRGETVT